MKRPKNGQSIVEMALIGPLLFVILFGIIELSYFIFAYTTISQSARAAAEQAAALAPRPDVVGPTVALGNQSDGCVNAILSAVEREAPLFIDLNGRRIRDFVRVSYPNGAASYTSATDRGPVQIRIDYPITSLTPGLALVGLNDEYTMTTVVRRTLARTAPTECAE